ncbi:Os05g0294800, partial [Oryza sativa Japonica Group]
HIAAPLSRQPPTRAHTHHAPSLPLPPFPAPPPTAAPPPAPLPDRREPPIVLLRQTPTSPHRAASPSHQSSGHLRVPLPRRPGLSIGDLLPSHPQTPPSIPCSPSYPKTLQPLTHIVCRRSASPFVHKESGKGGRDSV